MVSHVDSFILKQMLKVRLMWYGVVSCYGLVTWSHGMLDKISWGHEYDLVYHYGCNKSISCNCISISNYVSETNVRIGTRTQEQLSCI